MKSSALFALLCGSFLRAEDLPLESWHEPKPVPAQAKLSLEVPARLVIGQRMPAALVVENTGSLPFSIMPGGDYRSTGYPQRMKVRVRDAAGRALPELTQQNYGFGGGGICALREVHPGKREKVEFPLDCYVTFPKAGEYTVFAGHDLGWTPLKSVPIVEAKVTVVEPTAAEAAKRVQDALPVKPEAAQDSNAYDWEGIHTACVMRHPVYLPPLEKRATEGSVAAVAGIGHIATPEATQALITLAGHARADIAMEALRQLLRRTPALDRAHAGWRSWSPYQIDPLLPAAWKDTFEPQVQEVATRGLSHPSKEIVQASCALLHAESAATRLLEALQKAMDEHRTVRASVAAGSLGFPSPQQGIIAALDVLRSRGWRAERPGRTAQMVAWFRQLADEAVPKPEGDEWRTSMLVWAENGGPTVQICALQAIPQPLSDEAAKVVRRALDDRDWSVVRVACEVAGKSKRPEFAQPLVQIVETMHESFVQSAAIHAAKSCGARLGLWEALAANIVLPERLVESVRELALSTLDLPVGSGSSGSSNFDRDQRFAIRDAWRAFLKQHAAALSDGKKIPPPSEKVADALTGMHFDERSPVVRFDLKDGTQWPPGP